MIAPVHALQSRIRSGNTDSSGQDKSDTFRVSWRQIRRSELFISATECSVIWPRTWKALRHRSPETFHGRSARQWSSRLLCRKVECTRTYGRRPSVGISTSLPSATPGSPAAIRRKRRRSGGDIAQCTVDKERQTLPSGAGHDATEDATADTVKHRLHRNSP